MSSKRPKLKLKKLELKLEKLAPASTEIEKEMQLRDITIQEMKERTKSIEDTVLPIYMLQLAWLLFVGMKNVNWRWYIYWCHVMNDPYLAGFIKLNFTQLWIWIWFCIHGTQQQVKKRLEFDNQKIRFELAWSWVKSRGTRKVITLLGIYSSKPLN